MFSLRFPDNHSTNIFNGSFISTRTCKCPVGHEGAPYEDCVQVFAVVFGHNPDRICASGVAFGAGTPHYVVTNDDVPPNLITSVSFYTVAPNGLLTLKAKVLIGGAVSRAATLRPTG